MRRYGVTLLELVVVLAIIAVMSAVTGLATRRASLDDTIPTWVRAVAAARRLAIDSVRVVTIRVALDTRSSRDSDAVVTAYPDGTVVGDTMLGIDRLTGAVRQRHRTDAP